MSDESVMTFAALELKQPLLDALSALGYEAPTPIQEKTIPVLLAGRDLIGQAQTGTGKTAAFALPILQKLDTASNATQALVVTPTRELAMQVAEALHSYAQKLSGVSVLPVYGGAPIVHQLKRLERGVQIVVGTPGRLIDHLDRKSLRLDDVRMIVLDEGDEMLKMGFIDDIERLLAAAPKERQIALFSATMPDEILRIAKRYLTNPERVEIQHHALTAPAIEQRFINVSEGQKLDVLTHILELDESEAVLIFKRTKTGAAELAERLEGRGFAALAMHGDMNQQQRENVIRRLRNGQTEIVVATDVAARGLDVEKIAHVINYDIPHDVEAYVHRIGRTGRAGKSGRATLFVSPRERRMLREIERYTGSPIKPMKIPTGADVAARRVSQLKETIRKTIQEGDLDLYVQLVEELVEEGPHDIAEVAAAAARLASTEKPLAVPAIAEPPAPRFEAKAPRYESRPRARENGGESEAKVRLCMDVGKREGIRPADVVGSIANEAGIPGRDIGPIDIRDDITYVTLPERVAEHAIKSVANAKFRGHPVNLRIAPEESARQPRPSYGAARAPYADRRPPRRDFGDRPSRPAAGRPARRDFGDRPARPSAARPSFGAGDRADRKPYGADRKPYGAGGRAPDRGPRPAAPPKGKRPKR